MSCTVSVVFHFLSLLYFLFFFFNDTATTEIYTLSLHDALPISARAGSGPDGGAKPAGEPDVHRAGSARSEEHTSELQSHSDLVCRLLLEKKKKQIQDQKTHVQQSLTRVVKTHYKVMHMPFYHV